MTIPALASALQSRQKKGADEKEKIARDVPDERVVGAYTRCPQCGKSLFMDDGLIVDQSPTVEKFLERCTKRLAEHRCNSGSTPQN